MIFRVVVVAAVYDRRLFSDLGTGGHRPLLQELIKK